MSTAVLDFLERLAAQPGTVTVDDARALDEPEAVRAALLARNPAALAEALGQRTTFACMITVPEREPEPDSEPATPAEPDSPEESDESGAPDRRAA